MRSLIAQTFVAIGFSMAFLAPAEAHNKLEISTFAAIGYTTTIPAGYADFCRRAPEACGAASEPRDIVLTDSAWHDLDAVNRGVNSSVAPVSDKDNYGLEEWWTLPANGKGDCEDYVLMKRKILVDAGWPRSALLITVVRDLNNAGHAVLTVKTDRGEFVLDNQLESVVPWDATGYRYIKRQSQLHEDVWVSLGDTQGAPSVAAPRG